jgi:hypothetical protein
LTYFDHIGVADLGTTEVIEIPTTSFLDLKLFELDSTAGGNYVYIKKADALPSTSFKPWEEELDENDKRDKTKASSNQLWNGGLIGQVRDVVAAGPSSEGEVHVAIGDLPENSDYFESDPGKDYNMFPWSGWTGINNSSDRKAVCFYDLSWRKFKSGICEVKAWNGLVNITLYQFDGVPGGTHTHSLGPMPNGWAAYLASKPNQNIESFQLIEGSTLVGKFKALKLSFEQNDSTSGYLTFKTLPNKE